MCSDNTQKKKLYAAGGKDIHYPAQTNHDTCFIPESVRQYAGAPLYIIVALVSATAGLGSAWTDIRGLSHHRKAGQLSDFLPEK